MARPKKQKELTVADKFYIEQHATTMSVIDIATNLNVKVEQIVPFLPAPLPAAVPEVKEQSNSTVRVITDVEKFYISEKARTQTPEQIASDLGLTVEEVSPLIPASVTKERQETYMMQQMNRRTDGRNGKPRGGIAVMTPNASQISDTTRPTRLNGKYVDCIHRPLGD